MNDNVIHNLKNTYNKYKLLRDNVNKTINYLNELNQKYNDMLKKINSIYIVNSESSENSKTIEEIVKNITAIQNKLNIEVIREIDNKIIYYQKQIKELESIGA